jgi:hypothetical protein
MINRVCVIAIATTMSSPGFASELHFFLGGAQASSPSELTYSWALEYRSRFSDHLSGSFTWLNEGHEQNHHRDGQAVQLWWHTAPDGRRARFELGLGPYRYFDTVTASNAEGYRNAHGWGLVASAGATWPMRDGWLASLRINRVQVSGSINSTAVVAGLGYNFDAANDTALKAAPVSRSMDFRRSELDVMAGATIVNSLDADGELAGAVSWRVRATDHLTGSLTYLYEGKVHPGQRAGIAPQIWLEDDLTRRFSVGVGLGPYFATQKPPATEDASPSNVSALVSVTASYAITPDWVGRLTWNRVATRYDRDSDVVLFALGYRF